MENKYVIPKKFTSEGKWANLFLVAPMMSVYIMVFMAIYMYHRSKTFDFVPIYRVSIYFI